MSTVYSSIILKNIDIPSTLVLRRSTLDELKSIVEKEYPLEVCGVLAGKIVDKRAFVEEYKILENILESSTRFWFDERKWMETVCEFKRKGLEYIGLFHSHPDGSVLPSLADRHRMMECPGEIWLILAYSPKKGFDICAWVISDYISSFSKVNLVIT